MIYVLNGKRLYENQTFVANGLTYPANWLQQSAPQDRAALGIVEIQEQSRPDDRFYFVSDENLLVDGSYTATPKDLASLKIQFIAEIKETANKLLQSTDWKIIRQAETSTACDANTLAYRTSVRSASNTLETSINAASNIEELKTIIDNQHSVWPAI